MQLLAVYIVLYNVYPHVPAGHVNSLVTYRRGSKVTIFSLTKNVLESLCMQSSIDV